MKVLKRLVKATLFGFSFLVLLVLKLIQPIVRFQLCVVGFHRYGHLALEPEIFLAEQEIMKAIDASHGRVINIWSLGPVTKQSNRFLAKKWKDELLVLPSWFVGSLQRVGLVFMKKKTYRVQARCCWLQLPIGSAAARPKSSQPAGSCASA